MNKLTKTHPQLKLVDAMLGVVIIVLNSLPPIQIFFVIIIFGVRIVLNVNMSLSAMIVSQLLDLNIVHSLGICINQRIV
jgi:hypothetical protein